MNRTKALMHRNAILVSALCGITATDAEAPAASAPVVAPVGTAAKRAAKRPSKAKISKSKAKAAPKGKKAKLKATGKGPQVLREYVEKGIYKVRDEKTAGGNPSIDCGDKTASALRGKPLRDVYDLVSKKTNLSVPSLKKRFGHLNLGMQRMNLGNVLRAQQ